jgi:MoaA/NifB/PqqE/SkfB family radical SAM enzyme
MRINDPAYCILPFNHMNFHPNGNVSLCCVAKMFPPDDGFYRDGRTMLNLNNNPLKQIWEDSSVNDVRKQMLEGVKPNACVGCYAIEDNNGESRRQTENKRWRRYKEEPNLEFLDLRISNTCNLKCMMCYPDSSSSLMSDYKQWSDKLDFVPKNPVDPKMFNWFDEDFIEQLMNYKDSLKYLYINGGEPFIMPLHWKFLERLIEEDVAKNIHISYNTNCTTYDDKFSEYWKHFKRVTLGLSVDAIGDKNKFIRYPSNWETLNDNVLKFIHNPVLNHINITCSIQWLNAPFLDEFYNWAIPIINQKKRATINQNFIVFPHYLSLNCASTKFKEDLYKHFENSKYKEHILSPTMISYLKQKEEYDMLWNEGIRFVDTVETTRDMNWREVFNYDYRF